MGGDNLWALGVLIMAAMAAMVVGGSIVLFLVGRLIAGRSTKLRYLPLISGLAGAGIGLLAVIATFYEDTWAPPPHLHIELPVGYAHRNIILLEDPTSTQELTWRGVEIPFYGKSADLAAPLNGVVRLKSFGPMAGRGDAAIGWSDDSYLSGSASGPAPAGLNATFYKILERQKGGGGDPPYFDRERLGNYIRARESQR